MKVLFLKDQIPDSGTVVIPVFDKRAIFGEISDFVDRLGDQFTAAADAAHFTGKSGETVDLFAPGETKARFHFVGCGKQDNFKPEMFAAKVVKSLLLSGEKVLTFCLAGLALPPDDIARAAVGARLAIYRFDKYRTKLKNNKKPRFHTLRFVYDAPGHPKRLYANFHGPVCDGIYFARDLVNEPANVLYPAAYAARLKELEEHGVEVEILGEKKMEKLGMNALLGVGKGSERESQLVVMRWKNAKKDDAPWAAIVGKGVTFDSGGISLKPGQGMWDMKGDMGGSAAVSGTMLALAKRKAKANVVGVVGLVENMPDGKAQNPGDIVTSMSGQTIEVQNTDAEGRLVLADALHYTRTEYEPRAMINLATLTGAIIVSLGHEHAGMFSNNDKLADELTFASEESSERIWRMPLLSEYDKLLDSPNADMKNIGGREAGSITAAQFLQRFVGKTRWAHLDIAGTGMKNKRNDPRETTFGTGFGVRLLNHWIADNYEW